ncbi:MAG: PhoH family protein [Burkholderiales bacterium]
MTAVKKSSAKAKTSTKLFVLDTNVLMHDPTSLFRFEEHDVFLPMETLEELDAHKKGMSEIARNVRQASRFLEELITHGRIAAGVALKRFPTDTASGKLFLQTEAINGHIPPNLPGARADNQIIGVVRFLQKKTPGRHVILVTKDINLRIKARAVGIEAEDYFNDKVLEDSDVLYTGARELPPDFWDSHGQGMQSWKKDGRAFYKVTGPLVETFFLNELVYQGGGQPLDAIVRAMEGRTATLEQVRDYTHARNSVWGINARNREQNFALNLLMDPEIDIVTLLGQAGTGKTLLTLAAGLSQILDEKRYSEIIVTRVTVPVADDIGFLPGTEEEKMNPWMGALEDNLEVLSGTDGGAGEWGKAATQDIVRAKIKVKSINFMRGRTFIKKFLIIDEAQNLTPKQMKTLVTRAGPGTKVLCLGNLSQIDTPYLTEGSSGLAFLVDRFKNWPHGGHITLQRGERSRLADFASEVL